MHLNGFDSRFRHFKYWSEFIQSALNLVFKSNKSLSISQKRQRALKNSLRMKIKHHNQLIYYCNSVTLLHTFDLFG